MPIVFENIPFLSYIWENITIESVLKFAVIYFFVIWIAVVIWVIKDISNRTNNILLQIISIMTVLFFTPLGIFLYLLIRPSSTVFEKYYHEIEENLDTLSKIIDQKAQHQLENNTSDCPKCDKEVEADFVICPHCKYKLKNQCNECGKEIRPNWKVCPYCNSKQSKHKK